MPASALLLSAGIASLNLCTDEYLLLLARSDEIASVSYLSQDPRESRLWRKAKNLHANSGALEQVVARRPGTVLTMGGGGRATAPIARRLGMRAVDLKFVEEPADVAANLRTVAAAIGAPERAAPWIARLKTLQRSAPTIPRDAIFLSGNGDSLGAGSAGARWMRLAGLRQRTLAGERPSLETMIVRPPQVLLQSDYRHGQVSRGAQWLRHPAITQSRSRHLVTDGRAWTCLGPLMIAEIERLRRAGR